MAIPANITREHVVEAMKDLDEGKEHPFGEPTKYQVCLDGRRYPPKAVVGLAAEKATGISLLPSDFQGGEGIGQANQILRNLGFVIEGKKEDTVVEAKDSPVPTYLLTWNANGSVELDEEEYIPTIRAGTMAASNWSCGVTKRIKEGDRIFLYKQGAEPRGVIASGWVTSDVYEDSHWENDNQEGRGAANYIELDWDAFVLRDQVLDRAQLTSESLSRVNWRTQSSGIRIHDEAAAELETLWRNHLHALGIVPAANPSPFLNPESVERIRILFKERLPEFKTFEEPGKRYLELEDNYKREAIANAQRLLRPYVDEESVLTGDEEAKQLALDIIQMLNFLNWRDIGYIKDELLAKRGRWLTFMTHMLNCLRVSDTEEWDGPVTELLEWLDKLECRPNISKILPTYFLFMWDPETNIAIKPSVFDRFLKRLNEEPLGQGNRLTVEDYGNVYRVVLELKECLRDWKPRDFVDIHNLYWIVESGDDYGSADVEEDVDPSGEERAVKYTIDDAMADIFMPRDQFVEMLELLRVKKNLILQGPPGTGKTFVARRLAYALMEEKAPDRVMSVQFHQSYAYEDFIQGYRPSDDGNFRLKDGLFYGFCERAKEDPQKKYVFIIDEINRGNLSKILGELMMLIESDKRGPDWAMPLTYADDASPAFYVPKNLHLLGMMNTADRSLAMVDYALRRRFAFVTLAPAYLEGRFQTHLMDAGVSAQLVNQIVMKLDALNRSIREDTSNLGPGFQIGHSYFCPQDLEGSLDSRWYQRVVRTEIAPIIQEYWFDNHQIARAHIDDLLQGT